MHTTIRPVVSRLLCRCYMPYYPHGTCKTLYFNYMGRDLLRRMKKQQTAAEKTLHKCKSSRDLEQLLPRLISVAWRYKRLNADLKPVVSLPACISPSPLISALFLSPPLSLCLCTCVFIKKHHSHDSSSLKTRRAPLSTFAPT